jgi:hypothetical protein
MARKTHQQRVDEQEAKYREQLQRPPTAKEQVEAAEARAVALQKAALVAEIRRQRAIGEALDLQAALDAARGGSLVLPAAIAQGDLSRVAMAEWVTNVKVLSDLAQTAPSLEIRLEAADRAAQRTHEMLQLVASQGSKNGGRVVIDAPSSESVLDGLSREEKIALVRRQLARENV